MGAPNLDEETGDTTVGLGVVGSGIFPEETGFDIFGLDIVGSGIFPEETGFDIFGIFGHTSVLSRSSISFVKHSRPNLKYLALSKVSSMINFF
jgi:hypothetical protein